MRATRNPRAGLGSSRVNVLAVSASDSTPREAGPQAGEPQRSGSPAATAASPRAEKPSLHWGRRAVVLTVLLLAPLVVTDGYVLQVCSLGLLSAVLAMGVVVSYGRAGVPNMSQGTLFGVGAYMAANAMMHLHLPFPLAMLLGGVAGALVGALLGLTTLRVQGNYWWLITIAFTEVAYIVFNSWGPVTGGEGGLVGIPVATVGGVRIDGNRKYYYLGLVVTAVVYVVYRRFSHSRIGLATRAVGLDPLTSGGLGISPGGAKVTALALAGLGAGLAGACLPAITGYINAGNFSLTFSFSTMIFAIVGGLSGLEGSIVAAVGLTYLTSAITALVNFQLLIYGVVVLIALFLRLYLPRRTGRARRYRPLTPLGITQFGSALGIRWPRAKGRRAC
jgi:branched-chain amino acid transport system permease protein